jgi:hypothetical protein
MARSSSSSQKNFLAGIVLGHCHVNALLHNHFNLDRHLTNRDAFKKNRSAALAEWRQIAA